MKSFFSSSTRWLLTGETTDRSMLFTRFASDNIQGSLVEIKIESYPIFNRRILIAHPIVTNSLE